MTAWLSPQFLRFLLANSLAALVNILTRLATSLMVADGWAVLAGFGAGLSTSYLLCRGFVFQAVQRATPRSRAAEIMRFTTINLLALVLTWLIYHLSLLGLVALHRGAATDQRLRTLAHALGVAAPVLFSYLAQKTFTFRQRLRSHGT